MASRDGLQGRRAAQAGSVDTLAAMGCAKSVGRSGGCSVCRVQPYGLGVDNATNLLLDNTASCSSSPLISK